MSILEKYAYYIGLFTLLISLQAVFHISAITEQLPNETPQSFAEKLFESVDENSDGEISFEEFVKAAEEDETLIELLLPSPKNNNKS